MRRWYQLKALHMIKSTITRFKITHSISALGLWTQSPNFKMILFFLQFSQFSFLPDQQISNQQHQCVNYLTWTAWHWVGHLHSRPPMATTIWRTIALKNPTNCVNSRDCREGFWKLWTLCTRMWPALKNAVNCALAHHTGIKLNLGLRLTLRDLSLTESYPTI